MLAGLVLLCLAHIAPALAAGDVKTYLPKVTPGDFFAGADRFGPPQGDPPIVPVYRGDQLQGFVYST